MIGIVADRDVSQISLSAPSSAFATGNLKRPVTVELTQHKSFSNNAVSTKSINFKSSTQKKDKFIKSTSQTSGKYQSDMTSPNRIHHHNHNQSHQEHNHRSSSTRETLSTNSKRSDGKKSADHSQRKLRRNLELMDYDSTLTSMKPSASSSSPNNQSKNLISRLNELSSPVARKLRFWSKKSFQVNQYDPSFKVIYLGNLGMQFLSKDEHCLEKPLSTLWNNYLVYMKTEIVMHLTICNSGLKAITRQHGLTQYWSNRLVYCFTHKNYPKIFSWIYRHEGKKMRQELRCHAVFCPSSEKAQKMVSLLNQRLACALQEFKREKKSRELPSFMTKCDSLNKKNRDSIHLLQQTLPRTVPLRRQILAKGSANFRPPLDRSKSAPKLTSILEEDYDECYSDENDQSEMKQSFSDGQDSQHDEFEFEQSFGYDKDNDDDDDDDDELDIEGFVQDLCKLELEHTGNEESDLPDSVVTETNDTTATMTSVNNESDAQLDATGDNHSCDNQSTKSKQDSIKSASLLPSRRFDRGSFSRMSKRSSRNSSSTLGCIQKTESAQNEVLQQQ